MYGTVECEMVNNNLHVCYFIKKKWGALLIHTLVRTNLIKIVLWRALFRKWF